MDKSSLPCPCKLAQLEIKPQAYQNIKGKNGNQNSILLIHKRTTYNVAKDKHECRLRNKK